MKKQVKFSIDEVNRIVGQYVLDKKLLGNINSVDILFHQGITIEDGYILVMERNKDYTCKSDLRGMYI